MEEKILALLATLKPVESIVLYDLPAEFLDADLLAVAWADRVIDAGMRSSDTTGGVLTIADEISWTASKLMRDPVSWERLFDRKDSNPKLWPHVRISADGRLWLARNRDVEKFVIAESPKETGHEGDTKGDTPEETSTMELKDHGTKDLIDALNSILKVRKLKHGEKARYIRKFSHGDIAVEATLKRNLTRHSDKLLTPPECKPKGTK